MQLIIEQIWLKTDHFSYTSGDEFEQEYAYREVGGSDILYVVPSYYSGCQTSTIVLPQFFNDKSVIVIDTRDAPIDQVAMDIYSIVREHRTIFDHRFVVIVDVFEAELSRMLRERYPISFDGVICLVPRDVSCENNNDAQFVAKLLNSPSLCISAAQHLYAYREDGCTALKQMLREADVPEYESTSLLCRRKMDFPGFMLGECDSVIFEWCQQTIEDGMQPRIQRQEEIFNSEHEDSIGIYAVDVFTRNAGSLQCNNVLNLFSDVSERDFSAVIERFKADAEHKQFV